MCRATLRATPVKRFTVAASSIFSSGVRGTPFWAKTLKRVPEFPYAHEGVSIHCARKACFTAVKSDTSITSFLSNGLFEMEDLFEQDERLVGTSPAEPGEELGHLGLPAGVDLG